MNRSFVKDFHPQENDGNCKKIFFLNIQKKVIDKELTCIII